MQSYFAPRLQEIVYLIDCQLANAKKRLSGNDVDVMPPWKPSSVLSLKTGRFYY